MRATSAKPARRAEERTACAVCLRDYQPAVVLVMNSIYHDEIARHTARGGVRTELLPV